MSQSWDKYKKRLRVFNVSADVLYRVNIFHFLFYSLIVQPFIEDILREDYPLPKSILPLAKTTLNRRPSFYRTDDQTEINSATENKSLSNDSQDEKFLKILNFLNPFYWAASIITTIQRIGSFLDIALFGTPFDDGTYSGVGFFFPRIPNEGSTNAAGLFTIDPNDHWAKQIGKYFVQALALFTIRPILRGIPLLLEIPRLLLSGIGRVQEYVTYDAANQTKKWLTKHGKFIPGLNSSNPASRILKVGLSIGVGLIIPTALVLAAIFAGPIILAALSGAAISAIKSAFIAIGAWFATTVFSSSAAAIAIFATTVSVGGALGSWAGLKLINVIANTNHQLSNNPQLTQSNPALFNTSNKPKVVLDYERKIQHIVNFYRLQLGANKNATINTREKLLRREKKLEYFEKLLRVLQKADPTIIEGLLSTTTQPSKELFKQHLTAFASKIISIEPLDQEIPRLENYLAVRKRKFNV